ncbi:MAG: Rne/Rng family ribonuclease [Methylacidiphilales bacterium]|nr:Rne/Rng family ribonuclease [Candidatus Methylacidiphilales bacterium]
MKKILINVTHQEELRFATVENGKLVDLETQHTHFKRKRSNIYKGIIGSYLPSLDSVFVNFGSERHGFLPISHIDFTLLGCDEESIKLNKLDYKEILKKGNTIIVQVEKEERDSKGAFLTMNFSITGRNLVLLPNSTKSRGVSKTLASDERAQYREIIQQLVLPEKMGLIIRTAAQGKELGELQNELDVLINTYKEIIEQHESVQAPCLLFEEDSPVFSFIRDNLNQSVDEVYIDEPTIFEQVKEKMALSMSSEIEKLRHYESGMQLFNFFGIETDVESIHQRKIKLPSGGEIIFDPTEALTAIDVNSARATSGGGIEETAFNTNIEAANEIVRQLRLRDVGGLVVIDFIDMGSSNNQDKTYKHMLSITEKDSARIQIEPISKFGLMELTRQRLRPSLLDSSYPLCPTCLGSRHVRSIESYAISTLNLIEQQAAQANSVETVVVLAEAIATYLYNEKIYDLARLREQYGRIILIPSYDLMLHQIEIKRIEKGKQRESTEYLQEVKEQRAKNLFKEYRKNNDLREKNQDRAKVSLVYRPDKKSLAQKINSFFLNLFKKKNFVPSKQTAPNPNSRNMHRRRKPKKFDNRNRRPTNP